ncbi:MAG: hypothetical protein V1816_25565 [Pseudomonadota bacterium]
MKKTLLGIALLVGILALSGAAMAQTSDNPAAQAPAYNTGDATGYGPGYGPGMGRRGGMMMGQGGRMGHGGGQMMGQGGGRNWGPWQDAAFLKETAPLKGQLRQKELELRAALMEKDVDQAKAKALVGEISQLRGDLASKSLEAQLEFRKKNPDFQPGLGAGNCPGRGW